MLVLKKRVRIGILTLLILCTATLAFNIRLGKASAEELKVGVKLGDWAKYEVDFNYTTNEPNSTKGSYGHRLEAIIPQPPQDPCGHAENIESILIEVFSVNDTEITYEQNVKFRNGTERSDTMSIDLTDCYQPSIWFIPADLNPGNKTTQCYYSPVVNATLNRTYCGAEREVNYIYDHSRSWFAPDYDVNQTTEVYWDKTTGILVETNGSCHAKSEEGYEINTQGRILIDETNIWDAIPPSIVDVTQQPTEDGVHSDDRVMVYANITDDQSGVKRVILNYTTNNGTWFSREMTNLEGIVWNTTIPECPYGTNVTYLIMAEDNANNSITTEEMGYKNHYLVIPEFPSFLLLPLFMIITLLSVILYRRKHSI